MKTEKRPWDNSVQWMLVILVKILVELWSQNAVGLRTILGGGGMGRNVPQCIGRCSHSVSRSICSFVY